jgi:hypothetical protein
MVDTGSRRQTLEALRDLQAAVNVGVNIGQYGQYVIRAKQEIERIERQVPQQEWGSPFWGEIAAAMDDYEFAHEAWNWKFEDKGVQNFIHDGPRMRLIATRYPGFQYYNWVHPWGSPGDILYSPGHWEAWIEGVTLTAWASASQHIRNAEALSSR